MGEIERRRGQPRRNETDPRMALQRADRRLSALSEASKLLTSFQSVERTVPKVVEFIAKTVPIRNVTLVLEADRGPRISIWQTSGTELDVLRAASDHARASYEYLAHSDLAGRSEGASGGKRRSTSTAKKSPTAAHPRFVSLPLVVDHGQVFGTLQIEADGHWNERDLAFVNAIANQLAIAVARRSEVRARQERVEASEREQRLLAGVSQALASSLTYRRALSRLARFAVEFIADVCVIDEVSARGKVERVEVLFSDKYKQRKFAPRVRSSATSRDRRTPQAEALRSGKSVVLESIDAVTAGFAHDLEQAATMKASGITSMMAIPLRARDRTMGVLFLASTRSSSRKLRESDLPIVEEIARRSALFIDNARLYEQAQRATTSRDNLMAIVSHDLRNSLTGIRLAATERPIPGGEERRESGKRLATIRRGTDTMQHLIDDLLQAASLEAGRFSVRPRRTTTAELVRTSVEHLRPLAEASSLKLDCALATELPDVCADSERIAQVMANLVGNAIKATPRGGTITIGAQRIKANVRFVVADTGTGIPPEHLPHLFDRFWQATQERRIGNGLGLYIVKGIVEAHGGRLWVESTVGQGTSFFFSLRDAIDTQHSADR